MNKLEIELQELRAGYAALVDFVNSYQLCHDLDIDWEKFPKTTLCLAHKEIRNLRKKLAKYEKPRSLLSKENQMKLEKIMEYFENETNVAKF